LAIVADDCAHPDIGPVADGYATGDVRAGTEEGVPADGRVMSDQDAPVDDRPQADASSSADDHVREDHAPCFDHGGCGDYGRWMDDRDKLPALRYETLHEGAAAGRADGGDDRQRRFERGLPFHPKDRRVMGRIGADLIEPLDPA